VKQGIYHLEELDLVNIIILKWVIGEAESEGVERIEVPRGIMDEVPRGRMD
jgi:hypothetical protein